MSSRTKSFFEQDHQSKPRPGSWRRPQQDRVPLDETRTNLPPPKPPIPATSQAKTKLKAFQFVPGRPGDKHGLGEGQENVGPGLRPGGDVLQEKEISNDTCSAVSRTAMSTHSSRGGLENNVTTPQLPHANTFPSTPSARLSLEDLIGNIDDSKKAQLTERSPEEQIGWVPRSSATLLTPNRRRKRARSSSPSCPNTSSQRQEATDSFSINVTSVEKKTPEIDPAAELWQRYASGKQNIALPSLPDFSNIAFPASPRPLETPAKSGGLRRWASTGNDWPVSSTKRRRTNARAPVWREEQSDLNGRSKVAAMVEKLQATLATQHLDKSRQQVCGDEPSSSSPLPDTAADFRGNQIPRISKPAMPERPQSRTGRSLQSIVGSKNGRSDVDQDAGEDTATLRREHDITIPAPLHLQSRAPLPAFKRPSISKPVVRTQQSHPAVNRATTLPIVEEDLDEFAEVMDFTAADLDELLSQVPMQKRKLYEIPPHPNPPPQQPAVENNTTIDTVTKPATANPSRHPDVGDDDDFGDDDFDDESFMAAEISATQGLRSTPQCNQRRTPKASRDMSDMQKPTCDASGNHYVRFVVRQVVEDEHTDSKGRKRGETTLSVEDQRTRKYMAVTLRDSWTATSVASGDIIHVAYRSHIGQKTAQNVPGQIIVDDSELSPMLVVHPDHLISATTVADSFDCLRKAVLQDRIKATGETSKAMIYGKILHEIFQQALSANQWEPERLDEFVDKSIAAQVEGLWELGMRDTVLAKEEISAKMGELAAWARIFIAAAPSEVSLVDGRQDEKLWLSISKLIAIEEHIWSPQYGLKGNIDATVQATISDDPTKPLKDLIMPFEVKTGRTTQSPAHRAQTALYTLLLSDRYQTTVKAGILYYLESSSTTQIAPPLNETRQMIQQRNRLASYIHRARKPSCSERPESLQTQEIAQSGLPGPLKNAFKCGRCFAQQSCFTIHALVEQGSAESAGMIDDGKKNHSLVWHEAVSHLVRSAQDSSKPSERSISAWFSKWDRLLTFEESEMSRFRQELWTMTSSEREAIGRAFGGLTIREDLSSYTTSAASGTIDGIEGSGGRINRFSYILARHEKSSGRSFTEGSQMVVGEPVVVSSEQGQWSLAKGYVVAVSKSTITIAVDRCLNGARDRLAGFDDVNKQLFQGVMAVGRESTRKASPTSMRFRLDKDEFSNGLALIRNNLISLMSSHSAHTKLRDLIISGTEPAFATPCTNAPLPLSQLGSMNDDQTAAVGKVLSAQDYALILGMPGTGKTTTIAHIIRALLSENKSILLTSFTHTAVDNILLKIRDIAPPNSILRLGVLAKINAQVQEFCQLAATPKQTIDDVEETYMGSRIVATTCMGTNHALFNRRMFDVCIVDEASQITLPTSLGPLLHARKFVLVGDHFQLPPLVQNRAALEGGLDVSLFRQLSEEHPNAVAMLGKQYRMCQEIMGLSNVLIYDGKLRCGNEATAGRTLRLGDPEGLHAMHNMDSKCSGREQCWLSQVTCPQRKVLFVNTDGLGKAALESLTSGKSITNEIEAALTAQLAASLLALGVPGRDIGIITLYRSQLALLRRVFKSAHIDRQIEIDSADRFQGRDKECIILSMVRSNETGNVGDLLKDWRRVNVALTRARSKLVVIGSRRTLGNNDLLRRFLGLVDSRGWSMNLPKDAAEIHQIGSTPCATSTAEELSTPEKHGKVPGVLPSSRASPIKVLTPSASAGNVGLVKHDNDAGKTRKPAKVITGSRAAGSVKSRKAKELIAFDIFEDLLEDLTGSQL